MNPYRYYSPIFSADSLKELGWLRGHLMKRFTMMNIERRLAALACYSGTKSRAFVAGLVLPFVGLASIAGTASAAIVTHPAHLRRAAATQSAGTTETRGKVQPSRSANKRGNSAVSGRRAAERKSASRAAGSPHSEKADSSAARPRTKNRRRRNREPEMADDPVTMSRAGTKRNVRNVKQEQAAAQHADEPAQAAKKALTVDDFVRAAGGSANGGSANTVVSNPALTPPAQVYAQGVSHPDEDERITTSDAPAELPKAKPTATQKPAPVVRAAPEHQSADTALTGVSYDDAPAVADLPRSKVVQGFGGEVDVLPATNGGTRSTNASRSPIVATNANDIAEDRALQRESIDEAVKPMVVPIYTRSGKLMVPPPLKGTREILVHQNQMADQEGLTRIEDDADLDRMRAAHLLLPLPDIAALEVNDELPYNRRYARPWTVKFVGDIARSFYARFHEPLRLSSAVRTVDFQLRLQRVNGNAAAVDGDTASPHLTGQAVDFGKSGMSREEIAWMRLYLLPLMQAGKVDVEEEFQQACFHISVYGSYMPRKHATPKTEVAQLR